MSSNMPYFNPRLDIKKQAEFYSKNLKGDFTWSDSFDVEFIGNVMYEGFLPMGLEVGINDKETMIILAPKIHQTRCVMMLDKDDSIHIPRSDRKKFKKFQFSMNQAFDEVVNGIHEQHGTNWFYPPIVDSFKKIFSKGELGVFGNKVHLYSIELWQENENNKEPSKLVAGEVGYQVGAVYTSLSGFSTVSGSGKVQMLAMALYLKWKGILVWDLGMSKEYKLDLGAMDLKRQDFLKILHSHRNIKVDYISCSTRLSAADVLKLNFTDTKNNTINKFLSQEEEVENKKENKV